MEDARLEQLVRPFYLQMMRLNALEHGEELADALCTTGRTVSSNEVVDLLGKFWRERVMGAWFSLLCGDVEKVLPALLRALDTSNGSLDSPALTVAAVVLGGSTAAPAIEHYLRRDVDAAWGAGGFAGAAAESLGSAVAAGFASDRDRADFAALLDFARRLHSG